MSARSKSLCSTAEACRGSPCTWAGRMPNNVVRWAHQVKPAVSCMTVSPRGHLEPSFSPARSSCAVLGLLAEPRKLTCTPRTSSTLAGRTWQLQELTRPLVYNVKRPRNRHVDELLLCVGSELRPRSGRFLRRWCTLCEVRTAVGPSVLGDRPF